MSSPDACRRFAVYYLPVGPLGRFGSDWLGWDVAAGRPAAGVDAGLPDADEVTAVPRKYGFHATLKPPFRLAEGATYVALRNAVAALADDLVAPVADGLALDRGRFLSLRPTGDQSQISAAAARIVTELDHFRAPLTEHDLARRRAAGLTDQQEEHLARWGYPYVLDQFHFHVTLSGPLAAPDRDRVADALAPLLSPLLPDPFAMESISIAGEADDGRFHELARFRLASTS
ncbi:DUF1045 domain-containing protein [Pelagovum pacificum]|uniref:DUF1045 domain-containing protein n=1 Tax=Pelagovum pacificum TaxID=2588711 RepID=A0A5C5G993_9RHOB|nr:DUF1045 domain-containing protein [Pelagovum pacificum]QQA41882.1 DUF1045 domain-containing protein [Pelagovum pacificum]TNY30675.1 DUF1045 domain-containing protein [Pelagovum pacificum]